jgi:hypothetical protein
MLVHAFVLIEGIFEIIHLENRLEKGKTLFPSLPSPSPCGPAGQLPPPRLSRRARGPPGARPSSPPTRVVRTAVKSPPPHPPHGSHP